MAAAFSAADAVNAEPDADAVHSWYNVPEKRQKCNEQSAYTNGNAVWFFYQVNQIKAALYGNSGAGTVCNCWRFCRGVCPGKCCLYGKRSARFG